MKSAFLSLIVVLSVTLASVAPHVANAASPETVATVVAIRGTVVAKNAKGIERPLALKSPILEKDTLKTGTNGRLQLLFTDNSIISLGGASEMKVAEYRWQPEQNDGALKTRIKEGTFRVMGGTITKSAPQNFKTETPTATIGIRGSMYAGTVTPTTLSVVFQGGKGIEITNPFGTVAITKPGFGTHVTLNAAPLPPVKFTEKELGDLNKQLNGNGGEKGVGPAEEKGGSQDKGKSETTSGEGTQEGTTSNGDQASGTSSSTEGSQTTTQTAPAPTNENGTTAATEPLPAPEPLPVPTSLTTTTAIKPIAIDLPPTNELASAPTFTTPAGPPSNGIYYFLGGLGGSSVHSGTTETITGDVFMAVNWHNNTIFGAVFDPVSSTSSTDKDSPVFFFGHTSGSSVNNIQIFGFGDGYNNDITAIEGSGSGLFSGSTYDFFSFNATGASYLVAGNPQSTVDSWTVQGGTQQALEEKLPTSPTGTATWQGFVVGVSEDMNAPNTNRRLFRNDSPTDFTLAVNKDSGTLSGAITTGPDLNGGEYSISNLTVGGSYGSAYIRDDLLAAILGCPSDACVGSAGLKPHGNYMVIEDPEKQWSSYFTWGYWEIAYVDPNDSTQRHIHVPGSMWLAGVPSTNSVIKNGFTGSYSGSARGSRIDAGGVLDLNGTVSLNANFTAQTINGSISFPNVATLTIGSPASITSTASSNSFVADLSGDSTSGNVKGAFFGPNANAMGGNFYSSGGGKQYLGIFGGNKQ
jgi:hypothetical protein